METQTKAVAVVKEKDITASVLERIKEFQGSKALTLPQDYSPENALKSAYLILQETVDRDKKPVLSVCTTASIASCLLDMVVQGLSPLKKQCYFIAYGSKLTLSRSYFGSIAVAKRVGLKSVVSNVIYTGDVFKYGINAETGHRHIIEHTQELKNIDITKIVGAYAITEMNDGTKEVEIMNMAQIQKAWNQGQTNGASPAHKNFADEMCCKTVVQRAIKDVINSSDDSHLYPDEKDEAKEEIIQNANKETISFEDTTAEDVTPEPEKEVKETSVNGQLFPDADKTKEKAGF